MTPVAQRPWYPFKTPQTKDEWLRRKDEIRQYALDDLFFFSEYVMRDKKVPLEVGLHDELCYILQHSSDCLNLLPRCHLKSTIGSINYPIWLLLHDPNIRVVIFSAIENQAKKFIGSIKRNIDFNTNLRWLFPELRPAMRGKAKKEKWTSTAIRVKCDRYDDDPSIEVGGTGQTLTGTHCDVIVFDDIVTKDNANTPEKMETVKEWHQDVLHLLDIGFRKIYNGTRYRDYDLYADLIADGAVDIYRRKHIEKAKYIWPHPEVIRKIEDLKRFMSEYNRSCQFDNEPVPENSDDGFQPGWIKFWNPNIVRIEFFGKNPPEHDDDLLRAWYGKLNIYMGCDPARSSKATSDYYAIMVVGVDTRGRMFGLDICKKRMTTKQGVERFIKMFKKWKPINAKIETYGGDTHFYAWVKDKMANENLATWKLKEYKKTTHRSKPDKIRDLQFPAESGLIWLGTGPEWEEVRRQFVRFPSLGQDDCIDVLASIWLQQAKPKQEEEQKDYKHSIYERSYTGSVHGQNSWLLA